MANVPLHSLVRQYKEAMTRICTRSETGDLCNGSGFHIGDGYIVTARHVFQGLELETVTGVHGKNIKISDAIYPQDETIDLAVLKTNFHDCIPAGDLVDQGDQRRFYQIPLGGHLDDWIGDSFLMSKTVAMGYPVIPFCKPHLIVAGGEVSAIIDKYTGGHPHFIISTMARGGFSGGPVISEYDFLLGVFVESLVANSQGPEVGFSAVLSIEPLLVLLKDNNIIIESNWNILYESQMAEAMAASQKSDPKP